MAKDSTDRDQFMVRMPSGMRDLIATAAKNNGRSMNSEIVQRLHESFYREPSPSDAVEQLIGALEAQHERARRTAEAALAEVQAVEWRLQNAHAKRQELASKSSGD